MRKLAVIIAVGALALGMIAWSHRHAKKPGVIQISVTDRSGLAPNLTLTDLNGKILDTSSLKGKIVVVNFWAAWCTPCADEVPQFIALQSKYEDQGVQVVGISIDDSEGELRDFYRKFKMNYPVIAGSQQIAQAYGGILGLPTTLIIDRDGTIQKKINGATDFGSLEKEVALLLPKNGA